MLLSCGDALIDFLPVKSTDGRDAIVPVVGGSCLNIAVGMARLGAPTGFVGGISTDLFGRMIADHAMASQVELRYATRSDHQTTLAFVRTVAGEPQYAFYDEATASRNWIYRRGSIPFDEIEAIHVGSTTLVDDKGRGRDAGDGRGRARIGHHLVRSELPAQPGQATRPRYVERMDAFAAAADIVRMSDVDFEFLYGGGDYAGRAKSLIAAGASLVVVTRGIKGAQAWHREAGAVEVEAPTRRCRRHHRRRRQFSGGAVVRLARHRTDRDRTAGADEFRRASPCAVVCVDLRGLHMRARRRRSAAAS